MGQDAHELKVRDLDDLSREELARLVSVLRGDTESDFNKDQFEYVLQQVLEGRPVRQVLERETPEDKANAPSKYYFYKWLADTELNSQYGIGAMWDMVMRARSYAEFEEALQIADDTSRDKQPVLSDDGEIVGYAYTPVPVNRDRLRVDTRKWWVGKAYPKLWGDGKQTESGGARIETKVVEYYGDPGAPDDG
ncbi:MAG: terminase small subunit-like protein [Phycisphaerales bacterium]